SQSFRFLKQPFSPSHLDVLVEPTIYSLDENSPCNNITLTHEQWLAAKYTAGVSHMKTCMGDNSLIQHLSLAVKCLECEWDQLATMKRVEWERQQQASSEDNQVDPGQYMQSPFSTMEPWAILCYIIGLSLYLLSGVSQVHCSFY
ncbi:hypothetical protein P691DRAFT_630412, partial [Macrolepiota fuliginosa MF-IS2]